MNTDSIRELVEPTIPAALFGIEDDSGQHDDQSIGFKVPAEHEGRLNNLDVPDQHEVQPVVIPGEHELQPVGHVSDTWLTWGSGATDDGGEKFNAAANCFSCNFQVTTGVGICVDHTLAQ